MENKFVNVFELIESNKQLSIGTLAIAIENLDILVIDDYGRLVKASDDDGNNSKTRVLAALRRIQSATLDYDDTKLGELLNIRHDDFEHPLIRFGWRSDSLPNFQQCADEWKKRNYCNTEMKSLKSDSGEYDLIDALTQIAFDTETLVNLKTQGHRSIGKFINEVTRRCPEFKLTDKTIARIYRRRQ